MYQKRYLPFYLNKIPLNSTFLMKQNFYSEKEVYSELTAKLSISVIFQIYQDKEQHQDPKKNWFRVKKKEKKKKS